MDELIRKYAEITRNANVGDYTYEGILSEFAREVLSQASATHSVASLPSVVVTSAGPGSNTGHGHIWDRPDGAQAGCGGPDRCKDCQRDWWRYMSPQKDLR